MIDNTRPDLERALREHLVPSLRMDGFRGSGRTYRRLRDGWVQLINVQGSRHGGQFAVNLALQPLSIPHVLGTLPDARKITASLCEFRRRLSRVGADQWWVYEQTIKGMNAAVQDACALYESVGRELFGYFEGTEAPFTLATPDALKAGAIDFRGFSSTQARMALVLARLRRSQGRLRDAAGFAEIGLAALENATALRKELSELSELAAGG